jgi:sterol desaturase/sphingolipid hydroxylase (fatty acid hydroxylase superfamily)
MSLYWMLTFGVALSGLLMVVMTLAYHSAYGRERRIRDGQHGSANAKGFVGNAAVTSVLSVALVYGLTWALHPFIFHEAATSGGRVVWEGAAILLLYDFLYYLVHRYPFHEWRMLRRVHAVHHVVRNPSAIDSLYLHPVETFLGLALLWACAGGLSLVTGPVSVYSFAWAFLVYSTLNVVVHSGLELRVFPLNLITRLATRHDTHHVNMKGKNFASVTPIWDRVFGTHSP